MEQWRWMSASDLGRGIGRGEIDPVALTEVFLQAIVEHPQSHRIYVTVTAERARAEAAAAAERARLSQRRGPLDGVPVSWKDLFDSAGTPTEAGTLLMKGRIPQRDAEVLARATTAGLVCLGKTHMSEIAFSGLGYNPMAETPPNVHDAACAPGGSSSGAVASVAFGLAAAGIGSDTGGSVRIPAAWNDLVGLKTTHGLVSLDGVVPLCPSFDTVGPLCRTVEDAAALLSVLTGDAGSDLHNASLEGVRLLCLSGLPEADIAPEIRAGYRSAVERLNAAGAEIHRAEGPMVQSAMELSPVLYAAEACAHWRDTVEADPEAMYFQIRERLMAGVQFAAVDFVKAWDQLRGLREEWQAFAAGYDAVLMPTAPIKAPIVARLETDDAYYKEANLMALRNTRIGNLMGLCGLTLPTGVPMSGVMICADAGADRRLLRLGHAAERALA